MHYRNYESFIEIPLKTKEDEIRIFFNYSLIDKK